MKVLGRVILFVAIIVPIIVCVVTLNKVWDEDSEYNKNIDVINPSEVDNKNSGDTQIQAEKTLSTEKWLAKSM